MTTPAHKRPMNGEPLYGPQVKYGSHETLSHVCHSCSSPNNLIYVRTADLDEHAEAHDRGYAEYLADEAAAAEQGSHL